MTPLVAHASSTCVPPHWIGVAALSVKIEALEKQVSADCVDRVLVCVRQLAGRPVGLSDGTAIVAAIESLADVSGSAGHVDFKRHEAILKQCRPLTHDPRLLAVVTQLLGYDESKKIAGKIQKILKSDHLFSAPQVYGSPFPAPARAPRLSSPTGEWAWPIHSVWLWQLSPSGTSSASPNPLCCPNALLSSWVSWLIPSAALSSSQKTRSASLPLSESPSWTRNLHRLKLFRDWLER